MELLMSLETKVKTLIEESESCRLCTLGCEREERNQNMVFGEGNIPSEYMLIGESPGPEEEKQQRPFFPEAPSGELLDKLMRENGLHRSQFFITNAVICPPLNPSGTVMDSVRKDEIFGKQLGDRGSIDQCNQRLRKTIELVDPRVVVLLGAHAVTALFGKHPGTLSKKLGWQSTSEYPFRIFISYHPSYYLRQKSFYMKNPRRTEEDKQKIQRIGQMYRDHWKQISKAI